MKAATYYAPGDIRVENRPDPQPTTNNIIARVHFCAICGTDKKIAHLGNPRCHPPRIIGHEIVATIEHVGAAVNGFAIGERITLATTIACGTCAMCTRGLGNVCPHAQPISYDFDGGFAELIALPPEALRGGNVITVPESIPDEQAALCEPASCAINGMTLAGLTTGDTVLIIGGGPLGAIHACLALALGAQKVLIVQRSQPRLNMLRNLPNVQVIDGKHEDVRQCVAEATDGVGADLVVVCAGSRQAQEESVQYARKGGAISLFASLPKGASDITLDSRLIHYNELRVVGVSDSRPEHVQAVVDLLASGALDLNPVVTHNLPLARFHDGIQLMDDKLCLKVLINPRA